MREERQRRFFVTIMATDARRMRELVDLDLDLFASRQDESGYQVDGLITLEDVGRLVEAGYRVLVGDTDRPKRALEVAGFEDWRQQSLADLEPRREED
jgi:hypothetical protein